MNVSDFEQRIRDISNWLVRGTVFVREIVAHIARSMQKLLLSGITHIGSMQYKCIV